MYFRFRNLRSLCDGQLERGLPSCFLGVGVDFPVFSSGSFEEEGNSGVDRLSAAVLVWNIRPDMLHVSDVLLSSIGD